MVDNIANADTDAGMSSVMPYILIEIAALAVVS